MFSLVSGCQFVLAVDAVIVHVEAIEGHLRIGIIKGPFHVNALDQAVIGENDGRLHVDPHMGMCKGCGGCMSPEPVISAAARMCAMP